jgi:hypothetical protein
LHNSKQSDDGGRRVDFIEAVPFGSIVNGSGWAVAFWAVLYATRMIFKGQLVPRQTHEATLEALAIERRRCDLLIAQGERTADSLETFQRFVEALPQPASVSAPALPPGRRAQPGRPRRDENGRRRVPQERGGWSQPGLPDTDEGGGE